MHKLFEMINQEFEAEGTNYQVLLGFGICCRELRRLKVSSFRACMSSFCSVEITRDFKERVLQRDHS